MVRRAIQAVAVATVFLALAACVTIPPHMLNRQDVESWTIRDVELVVSPSTRIAWPEGEYAVIKASGLDPNNPDNGAYPTTPAGQAELTRRLTEKVAHAIRLDTGSRLKGPRSVKVVVTVLHFQIPSVAMRIFVGGAPIMRADIAVLDQATGARLASYIGGQAAITAGHGVGGVILDAALSQAFQGQTDHADRLIAQFVRGFNGWLFEGR